MTTAVQDGAIEFAEKVLELLDEGRYTATYKFSVLLALIDLCLEHTERSGAPPDLVTTRQLADKLVELYWPHTNPFAGLASALVLKQNTIGQAEIVSAIMRFRSQHSADPSVPRWESRMKAPEAYERLVRFVEWKLVEMPLPRLQVMGQLQRSFIYELYWDDSLAQSEVTRYQRAQPSGFDNRVMFKPNVGEYFLRLNGLLRPLIQRRWAAMVAQLNRLEESQLEAFLFGVDRIPTSRVRVGLWEIQQQRCFYCDARIPTPAQGEVDHFVPWSRYPDDGLHNFVVADKKCNGFKSNSLAAADHLAQWVHRFTEGLSQQTQFDELGQETGWDMHAMRSVSVARAIYLRLPADARLWLLGKQFVAPDAARIGAALSIC